MAAGGVDVSRRSRFLDHAKQDHECDFYRRDSHDSRSSRDGRNGVRHHREYSPSFYYCDHDSGVGRNCGRHGVSIRRDLVHERLEAQRDCEVWLPSLKKRKFTTIRCDIEDKLVRSPSRQKTQGASIIKFPPRPFDELWNLMTDVDVTANSLENEDGLEQLIPFSVPPSSIYNVYDTREGGQIEGDVIQAPSIATSRWASDLECPEEETLSDFEDIPKTKRRNRNSSTPESGEFLIEESEGQRSQSSGSDRGGRSAAPITSHEYSDKMLESTTFMDVDESYDSAVSKLEDEEPTFSQGGMNMLLGSRSVDDYEKLNKISEGTYGVVYRARDRKTGEIVALKKVKMNLGREDEYGFPLTSLREINILLSCNHPSIINVKEVAVGNSDSVFMVMEHLEHDLKGIIGQMKLSFSTSEVKCLMIQLLEGLKYLHHNWIIHRDLKPSNLLLNNKGELKICDFGMARQYGSPLKPYTQLVVTQWYRAPELLLGAKQYSTAIDMWSVGCILAELLSQKPLFQGKGGSDIDQLHKIFRVLGTPNEMIWPGFSTLPGAKANFVKQPSNLLRQKFPAASFSGSPILSDLGFDLLNKLLAYDPEKRLTVDAALDHGWFHEVPLPKSKEFMPTFPPRRD